MTRTTARRLWALDGARLTMNRDELLDGADPTPVELVVPSFLIEHDHGLVLVDTGLDPDATDDPAAAYGEIGTRVRFHPDQHVDRQLATVGFRTTDVTHVVLSHVHFDHTGGLRLFPDAHFLLGSGDRESVFGRDDPRLGRRRDLEPTRGFDWTFLGDDHDVFDDGALTVLAMPGHTPGNTSLLVRLPGRTVLLAGDTVHLHAALDRPAPMSADSDRDAALGSVHRLIEVARREDADPWVAHDPDDWARFGAPGEIGPDRG